jgi:glycosyltransferase involved in cell wall biosynthesis
VDTCIASLKSQAYSCFEAIFVDDGSVDDTAERITACSDERFVLLQQDKKGVSAARNLGLSHAHGKYLAFMDIDDIMEPEMLQSQLSAITGSGADIVLCDYKKVYPNGKEEMFILPWKNQLLCREQIMFQLLPWSIWRRDGSVMGSVCRTLINKEFLDRNEVFFDNDVAIAEDLLFLLKIYAKTESVYINSKCLYRYYMHSASTVNRYKKDDLAQRIIFYDKLKIFLKTEGLYEANQSNYQNNKCRMYTALITNYSRNPCKARALQEIGQLKDELIHECFDWRKCELAFLYRLSLWLLEKGYSRVLYRLYRIKERIRLGDRTNKGL